MAVASISTTLVLFRTYSSGGAARQDRQKDQQEMQTSTRRRSSAFPYPWDTSTLLFFFMGFSISSGMTYARQNLVFAMHDGEAWELSRSTIGYNPYYVITVRLQTSRIDSVVWLIRGTSLRVRAGARPVRRRRSSAQVRSTSTRTEYQSTRVLRTPYSIRCPRDEANGSKLSCPVKISGIS